MTTKLFLTINAVLGVLYGVVFVLLPGTMVASYGVAPEPHINLTFQFFGSALLGIGIILWFARDFTAWDAVRGVLIGNIVADVVGLVINLYGTLQGVLNAMAWTSTVVYVLLLAGLFYCLQRGSENTA